jgi:FAD:protein FMN transferase
MVKLGPFKKLGTMWWFEFFDIPESNTEPLTERLLTEMDRFEKAYSRFLPDSVVTRLNDSGVLTAPSTEFCALLRIAEKAYIDTKGVFNIAVGNYLEQTGYDAQYSFESKGATPVVPVLSEVLVVDDTQITLKNGARIDLGGFGKGYLIDRLAELLVNEKWSAQFLINGGGDMYVTHDVGSPITIGLQHPQNDSQVGSLPLQDMGFAASSPYLRRWKDQHNKVHHHLVGNADAGAVYVVGPDALTADIWATTLAINPDISPPTDVTWFLWTPAKGVMRKSNEKI